MKLQNLGDERDNIPGAVVPLVAVDATITDKGQRYGSRPDADMFHTLIRGGFGSSIVGFRP